MDNPRIEYGPILLVRKVHSVQMGNMKFWDMTHCNKNIFLNMEFNPL